VDVSIEKFHGKGAWLKVIMTEGRKRQIRETARQLGLPVVKIIRTRISTLTLGNLKPGQYRELNPHEITQLKKYSE
jgi:23S rRNA pseudouridine2605 synthase